MRQTKFVKPAKGLIVRDPVTGTPLPEAGANVEWTTYWRRRLTDGSIAIAEPPAKTSTSKTMSQSDDSDRKEKGGSRS